MPPSPLEGGRTLRRGTYQALDDLQQLLHDDRDALVAEQPADDLEVRGPHEVPEASVDAGVRQVQRLRTRGECGVRTTQQRGALLCQGALCTRHPGRGRAPTEYNGLNTSFEHRTRSWGLSGPFSFLLGVGFPLSQPPCGSGRHRCVFQLEF